MSGSTNTETTGQTKSGRDWVIAWLNDALAMENALAAVLKHRIADAKGYPAVEAADRQHLEETLEHAEAVKRCIASLGEKPSTVKSTFGTIFGMAQAPMTGLAKDEVVKNCLVDHAAENFEVASYASLIAAANAIGESEIAAACEQNMRQDQAMAERLMALIPEVTLAQMGENPTVSTGRAASGEQIGHPLPPEVPADMSAGNPA